MKKVFLMLMAVFLCFTFLLSVERTNQKSALPVELAQGQNVIFSEKYGLAVHNNNIYVAYITNRTLMLSKSTDNGESFETYILSGFGSLWWNDVAPVVLVTDNGECDVFFIGKCVYGYKHMLKKARFSANQEIEYEILVDNVQDNLSFTKIGSDVFITTKHQDLIQLSSYMYFTEKEISLLSDNINDPGAKVYFDGDYNMGGRVHSNSDIRIIQSETGTENDLAPGWPVFHSEVTSAGNIYYSSVDLPVENLHNANDIFRGGYQQNKDIVNVERASYASLLRPFGVDPNPSIDIIYVNIQGSNLELTIGNIIETGVEEITVYSSYPDALNPHIPIGDSLYTNYITRKDTIWYSASSPIVYGTGIYLPATVWVKGTVRGSITIYTPEDAYIIGNISYYNTPLGQSPEDNEEDYFALISEKSIYVKYKYKDPYTGEKISEPMSVSENGNTYLYGAYAAMGKGGEGEFAYKNDGVFSYEYQNPYGSPKPFWGVSQFTGVDTLFTNIDFHRFKYPPDVTTTPIMEIPANERWRYWPGQAENKDHRGFPTMPQSEFPYYTVYDYPWKNPVYPETANEITYLRGNLWIFGSVVQTRKGLLKRSGDMNEENPDLADYWDLNNFKLGPMHNPTGYNKKLRYDPRLENHYFATFPYAFTSDLRAKAFTYNLNTNTTVEITLPENSEDLAETSIIFIAGNDENIAMIIENTDHNQNLSYQVLMSNNSGQDFNCIDWTLGNIIDLEVIRNDLYVLMRDYTDNQELKIVKFSFADNSQEIVSLNTPEYFTEDLILTFLKAGNTLLVITDFNGNQEDRQRQVYSFEQNELVYLNSFNLGSLESKRIHSINYSIDSHDYLFAVVKASETGSNVSTLYYKKIDLSGYTFTNDTVIMPDDKLSLYCYPNPFNPETTIEFSISKDEFVELNVFNIRGQKVRTLNNSYMLKGTHKLIFNGKDDNGSSLASGIYFLRISTKEQQRNKKILLLK